LYIIQFRLQIPRTRRILRANSLIQYYRLQQTEGSVGHYTTRFLLLFLAINTHLLRLMMAGRSTRSMAEAMRVTVTVAEQVDTLHNSSSTRRYIPTAHHEVLLFTCDKPLANATRLPRDHLRLCRCSTIHASASHGKPPRASGRATCAAISSLRLSRSAFPVQNKDLAVSRQNTRSQAAEPHEQGVVFPQISDIHFHPCAGQALAVRIFTLRMQAKALLPISLQKPSLGPPAAALAPPSMESCPYADTRPHRCRCSDWTLPRT
jgi:hypothetical protein